jgi:hypothetical protein
LGGYNIKLMFNVGVRTFTMTFIQETCTAVLGLFHHIQFTLLAALQVNSVPEPETTGMLVATLALICAIARRRKSMMDQ